MICCGIPLNLHQSTNCCLDVLTVCCPYDAAAPTAAIQPAATQTTARKTQEGTGRSLHVVAVP